MDPPTSWVEGFSGYDEPAVPEHHLLWSSVYGAMIAVNAIKKVFAADPPDDDDDDSGLGFVNDTLVVGGFSAGGVASLILNTQDPRPDGVFTLSATGAWDYSLAQDGSSMTYLLTSQTYSDPFDPFKSIDCGEVRPTDDDDDDDGSPPPVAEQKACQVVDYFDPVSFIDEDHLPKHPALLVVGAQDEVFPIPAFQATFNFYQSVGTEVHRHLVGDFDHHYYWWVDKSPRDYEAYGSYDPTWQSSDFFPFNHGLLSIRNFVQNIDQGNTPLMPPGPVVTWLTPPRQGNNTYRVASCWNNTQCTGSECELRFNVSIDKGYHVLPACTNGSWSPDAGTYTISNSAYDYDSVCAYETDDDWDYSDKCSPYFTGVSTDDAFTGVAYTFVGKPSAWTCRRLDVVFANANLPDHFMYWTELRWTNTTAPAIASSGVQTYGSARSMCLRPRVVNGGSTVFDLLDAMGADDDDDKTAGACPDVIVDSEIAFRDGDVLNYGRSNLVFTGNGALVGEGSVIVNVGCDLVVKEGGRIAATNGSIGVTARNVMIDGVVEALGDNAAGGVSVIATGDLMLSGAINARTTGEASPGQVYLSATGFVTMDGAATASGLGSGGAISVFTGADLAINGALLADAAADGSFGGRMELHSPANVTIGDNAQLSTRGGFDDGQILIFYGEDLSINEDAVFETDDLQEVNLEDAALPIAATSLGAANASGATGRN
jgi:hypothetical protein